MTLRATADVLVRDTEEPSRPHRPDAAANHELRDADWFRLVDDVTSRS